jgi:hypothetical protein
MMCGGSVSARVRALLLIVPILSLGCATAARAELTIEPGSFHFTASSDQAGGHADLTTSFAFVADGTGDAHGNLRNVEVELPPGFVGYPPSVATCTQAQLLSHAGPGSSSPVECPVDSQIGTIEMVLYAKGNSSHADVSPVYNMVPGPGQTAVFGFNVLGLVTSNIVFSVRPGDFGLSTLNANVSGNVEIDAVSLTVWGVPGDPIHNPQRGEICVREECEHGGLSAGMNPTPFLSNPTSCTVEPLKARLRVEAWQIQPPQEAEATVGPFEGCEDLGFDPALAVNPESHAPVTPTGYTVDLTVPPDDEPEGVATSDVRKTVVAFPPGVVLSPSAATGLEACTGAQVGLGNSEPVRCPEPSRIGTATVTTPALNDKLTGGLYLGAPPSGPITGPPYRVFLTLAGDGVSIKLAGTVAANPATGQLTTAFANTPQLPFSELELHINGGSRAPLANPASCGLFEAKSDITPWTSPFEADSMLTSTLEITGCQAPRFAPTFVAGTTSNQAGGYTPLTVTFSREDADQNLAGLTVTTPPGLSGNLSKISLCGEPQAAEGTCPEASRIGELIAGAGPGPEPFFIRGGKVFITGPYHGAPFGLSIDVPERAGPFDLGSGACDCEVVRATVNLDPHTAQLTVSNGALPTTKDGIPFQVKTVNVDINRPEFVFNPTSCNPMSVDGTLSSTQGATAAVSSHFQVTNCAALAFNPAFKVSTSAHTSRLHGASLTAKLSFPSAPQGTQADIARVKVELPKQLPSRLTTLQKACTAATFETDPANCPISSIVGYAKAITPILPVPLEGPAFFVSHGGEAFPSLIVVLQGYGVTVDLVGTTFISKHGITSSTFKTVPDVPVGSFELTLPEGRFSALGASLPAKANGSFCGQKLAMPTEFVAQNGAEIRESTPISVTGCRKAKRASKASRARKAGRARGAGHRNSERGGNR